MTIYQFIVKRSFDILLSSFLLLTLFPIILFSLMVASVETRSFGIFYQTRIGKNGAPFLIFKIKTMKDSPNNKSTVTSSDDLRISYFGKYLRKYKIDELPQLFNVLLGQMSFVGPRPDVPGYADKLCGSDKVVLSVAPGITGPASLKYRNEEFLLKTIDNKEAFNNDVIWPDKVRINVDYVNNYSFFKDLIYIKQTLVG